MPWKVSLSLPNTTTKSTIQSRTRPSKATKRSRRCENDDEMVVTNPRLRATTRRLTDTGLLDEARRIVAGDLEMITEIALPAVAMPWTRSIHTPRAMDVRDPWAMVVEIAIEKVDLPSESSGHTLTTHRKSKRLLRLRVLPLPTPSRASQVPRRKSPRSTRSGGSHWLGCR